MVETVTYRGVVYRRYPESKSRVDRSYFRASKKDGRERLHRQVWIDNHGPIPEGYQVHHKDEDTGNNDPSNLELTTSSRHTEHHMEDPDRVARAFVGLPLAHEGHAQWKETPQAREQMREHYEATLRVPEGGIERTCEECGGTYTSHLKYRARFCSRRCMFASRRRSGVDREERSCQICGDTYECAKSSKGVTCSAKCAAAKRHAKK